MRQITKIEDFRKDQLYHFKSKPAYGTYTETIAALDSTGHDRAWFEDVHFICGIDCNDTWEVSQSSLDRDWEAQEISKEENPEYFL